MDSEQSIRNMVRYCSSSVLDVESIRAGKGLPIDMFDIVAGGVFTELSEFDTRSACSTAMPTVHDALDVTAKTYLYAR